MQEIVFHQMHKFFHGYFSVVIGWQQVWGQFIKKPIRKADGYGLSYYHSVAGKTDPKNKIWKSPKSQPYSDPTNLSCKSSNDNPLVSGIMNCTNNSWRTIIPAKIRNTTPGLSAPLSIGGRNTVIRAAITQ